MVGPRLHAILRVPVLPNPAAEEHLHAFHELVLVERGRYAVRIASERVAAGPGDSVSYPAGLRHVPLTWTGRRSQLVVVQWQGDPPGIQPRLAHDHDGRLRLAADWLWQLALARPTTPPAVLDGLLLALLHQRIPQATEQIDDDLFTRAQRYLAGNLTYDLSLTELADSVGVSPATLRRRFLAQVGEPPMRYRSRLRVERVLNLLRSGDTRPLAVLAASVGFANAFHLSRAVREATGRPPSAWREGRGQDRRGPR